MAEQSTKQVIRNTTLQTLVKQTGLTPKEIAQLRLSNLHLAGKKPRITFSAIGSNEPKSVELNLEAHRALVGWLVARPDSASDFLFPGQDAEPMAWQEIQQLVEQVETTSTSSPPQPKAPEHKDKTPVKPGPVGKPETGPPKPTPPRSAPELGAPPPGMMGGRGPAFQPPPTTAPEEATNIPLPTSAPKPSPTPAQSPHPFRSPVPMGASQKPSGQPVTSSTKKDTGKVEDKAKGSATPLKTPVQESITRQSRPASRIVIPIVVVVIMLLCGACGFGGWSIWQSDAGNTVLARLGITDSGAESFPNEREIIASLTPPASSPIPTPTLPPTSTPTLPPATNTPVIEATPTNTPVSETAPTETAVSTATPEATPTETPANTATSAPAETPVNTATPEARPTAGIKYPTPTLLEPEDGAEFIQGNIIVLRWQPIPDLAPDEQYALRMFYRFENEIVFQGTNTRDAEWAIPPSLHGQIDGPENLYEWFVVVERLGDDGSGTAISPESEHWKFTWK